MPAKIPATVVTGFLGAGKTTLIRRLIERAGGRRIALIINEFGDLGVDGEIVKGCGIEGCAEEDVVELSNGCICCAVADDFLPAIEKLLARDPAPEHIVIETSGLALPQPLVRAFNWPDIRTRVTVDGVVTVVDGPALAEGRFAADETAVDRQLTALGDWPSVTVSADSAFYLSQGQAVLVPKAPTEGWVRIYHGDAFLAVGEVQDDGRIAPRRLRSGG